MNENIESTMTMKRYIARDMRAALRQIRAEQGADAVILSTQQTAEGVEVCAAAEMPAAPLALPPLAAVVPSAPAAGTHIEAMAAAATGADTSGMGEEVRNLRKLLETHLAALSWNDFTRRDPLRARALTELTQLGISRDVAWAVLKEMPDRLDAETAEQLHYGLLARRVRTCASPVDQGGVVAVIGPPGAGKSTLLAKLATRWVMEHGPENMAIVTTDMDRLGSTEQLRALGRVLGVECQVADDAAELVRRLDSLSQRALVLVDTAGIPARDAAALAALGELTAAVPAMINMLVLPASAQGAVIEDCLNRFRALAPACAVLTRTDEAASLGGALAALIRAQLPVALLGNGPRIPEDLRPARAEQLVALAIEAALQSPVSVDEDLLAQRFGGALNAAA